MKWAILSLPALALAACESPNPDIPTQDANIDYASSHSFIVEGGAGAVSANLTLNGETTSMRETERNIFAGRRQVGDASGRIEIIYNGDGATAYCAIDYITNGDGEPHRYVVDRLECQEQ